MLVDEGLPPHSPRHQHPPGNGPCMAGPGCRPVGGPGSAGPTAGQSCGELGTSPSTVSPVALGG